MSLVDVLKLLKQHKIQISLEDGQLKVNAAKGAMTKELMLILKEHKAELLDWAKEQQASASSSAGAINIPVQSRNQSFPLSHNQQRLWLLHKIAPETASYNMPMALKLSGDLNLDKLNQALNLLIERHDVFNVRLHENNNGEVFQSLTSNHAIQLTPHTLQEYDVNSVIQQSAIQAFQLINAPLFKIELFKIDNTDKHTFILLFNIHHIISDRVSVENLFHELGQIYLSGGTATLPVLSIDYLDYAAWQNTDDNKQRLGTQLHFWKNYLSGSPSHLNVPTHAIRSASNQYAKAKTYKLTLDKSLAKQCNTKAKSLGLTPFMFYFAAQQLLLSKLAQQDDFCIAVPIAGRHIAGTENLMGYFVNTLALRSNISSNPSLEDFFKTIKHDVLAAFDNQDTPLDQVIASLNLPSSSQHSTLIQYGFNYINQQVDTDNLDAIQLGDINISPLELGESESKYEQIWSINDKNQFDKDCIELAIEYNTALFTEPAIAWFSDCYQSLLRQFCYVDLSTAAKAINLQSNAELETLALEKLGDDFEALLPLTPMQRDLHIDSAIAESTYRNYFGQLIQTEQELDERLLEQAIQLVTEKYSTLRQRIIHADQLFACADGLDHAYAAILKPTSLASQITLDVQEWKNLSEEDCQQRYQDICYQRINCATESLFRYSLIHHQQEDAVNSSIIISAHHSAIDVVGMNNIATEISTAYQGLAKGLSHQTVLSSLNEDCFLNYVNTKIQLTDSALSLSYWKKKSTLVETLASTNHSSQMTAGKFHSLSLDISAEIFQGITDYCQQHQLQLASYLKACFSICLASNNYHQEGLFFDEAIACRPRAQKSGIACYFEQRPVIIEKSALTAQQTFLSLCQHIEQVSKEAAYHYPLSNKRHAEYFPSSQASYQFNQYIAVHQPSFNAHSASYTVLPPIMDNAVNFMVVHRENHLTFKLCFFEEHFNGVDFLPQFIQLANIAQQTPLLMVGEGLTHSTKTADIIASTEAVNHYVSNVTFQPIIQSIYQQAEYTPNAPAVIYNNQTLNYQQLIQKTESLSQQIKNSNTEGPVGICLERSSDFIIAVLATLRSARCYIPIDSQYPQERIDYILNDANASLIISHSDLTLNHTSAQKLIINELNLNTLSEQAVDMSPASFNHVNESEPFYTIYTSGSTGQPKGASVSQRNAQLLSQWYSHKYNIQASDNLYIISAIGFDLSQKNIFAPLMSGASIILPSESSYNENSFLRDIQTQHVSLINCAPSAFYPIAELAIATDNSTALSTLRYVLLGGEAIDISRLLPWLKSKNNQAQIVNMYGPTECTDISAAHTIETIEPQVTIPIGTPPPYVQTLVVDPWMNPTLPGCAGELIVAGASIGLGYLNRDSLNASQFIDSDIFSAQGLSQLASPTFYRTGDLVVENHQQSFNFLARLDHQVKIRGLRIELGEIEQKINTLSRYSNSLCLVENENIIAYALTTENTQETQNDDWRSALSKQLPEYMLPAQIIELEAWPLTANGKIDRKALPKASETQRSISPARNETEQTLVDIWQSILGIEPIGIYNNFFELGGHSLLAARIATAIKQHFHVEVSLRNVFEEPTIAHLAAIIEQLDAPNTTTSLSLTHLPESKTAILSAAQERLWFIDQLSPGSNQYNIPFALKLNGVVNIQALQQSFEAVVQRHQVLRTRIQTEQARPILSFNQQPVLKHTVFTEDEFALKRYAADVLLSPFNLSNDALIRMELVEHSPSLSQSQDYLLLLSIHHIIADGWSIDIFIRDLIAHYQHLAFNTDLNLPTLSFQYSDYAWSEQQTQHSESDSNYWQQRLQGATTIDLPYDYERPAHLDEAGAQIQFSFPAHLSQTIKAYAKEQQSSLFNVLQAAFSLLLSQYSSQDDIILGTPVANRHNQNTENMMGFFANTLALRTEIDQSKSFNALVKTISHNNLDDFEHQGIQFEQLIDRLDIPRELNQTPLFNVMLVLQANSQSAQQEIKLPNFHIQAVDDVDAINSAKFDITLNIADSVDGIKATIEYRTALFRRESIEQLYKNLEKLLVQCTKDEQSTNTPLENIDLFSIHAPSIIEANKHWPDMDNYCFVPFIKRFEAIACNNENATALAYLASHISGEQKTLTYKALNTQANYLAHYLLEQGLQHQDVVAICMPRSAAMMQALLAVQKIGAIYVPIDLSLPKDRAAYMIENSGAKCIVVDNTTLDTESLAPYFATLNSQTITLINTDEKNRFTISDTTAQNPQCHLAKSDLAYILYTSGSTGKPKGTLIEQLGFDHYLQFAATSYYKNAQQSVVSSSLSFDATITSLYSALCQGKTCYITHQNDEKFDELAELIFSQTTPSLFKITPAHIELFSAQYAQHQSSLIAHMFIIGGDQLKTHQLMSFQKLLPNSSFVNEYGPTETVVGCCVEFVTPETDILSIHPKVINIGYPISYTGLYILDNHKRLVPQGIAGELYIAGFGVGRAYLAREQESQAAFIKNTFSASNGDQHLNNSQRLYRTGDMVKQQSDGKLVYLGRADDQVKIRGLRIELGEIEHHLNTIEGIQEPIVLAKTLDKQDPQLIAYYLNTSHKAIDENSIKRHLSATLPQYMLPSAFCALDIMPLTPNGKVDKKALLAIETYSIQKTFTAADGEIEIKLSQIWEKLLGKTKLSASESFFELGGHSLLAIQLASQIEQTFFVAFSVRQVFEYASIKSMASYIEQADPLAESQRLPAIAPIDRTSQRIPLSFNQQRLWFVYQLDKAAGSYNMPTALRINGELDLNALKQAAEYLIARHELLRTVLHEDSEGSFQTILNTHNSHFNFNTYSLNLTNISQEDLQELLRKESSQPFLLEQEPAFRVTLWQCDGRQDNEFILLINLHHIIGDAISLEVLVGELIHAYIAFSHQQQPQLPIQTIQYADYAAWQQTHIHGEYLEQQLNWWQKHLLTAPALLNLPTDFMRPARQNNHGKTFNIELPSNTVQQVKDYALNSGLTPFMILLAAQKLLFARLANQDDICIGVPLAGRHTLGTENLLGFFINALVIRSNVANNPSCEEFLQTIKHNVLAAFSHQDAPFEKVIERLDLENNPSYNPLVQVGFNYIHQQRSGEDRIQDIAGELEVEGIDLGNQEAKYDQIWAFLDDEKGIHLSLEYKTSLFTDKTVQTWISSYIQLLDTMLNQPTTAIKKLNYLNSQNLSDSFNWPELQYTQNHVERIEPLTPMQRDMYIDQLLHPDNRRNYLGWIQHADQLIDNELFQQAVDIITEQHSAMRMRIVDSNNHLSDPAYQVILKAEYAQVKVKSLDWSTDGDNGQPLEKQNFDLRCNKLGFEPYDMANDSLIRLFIIKDTPNTHTIVLSGHHTCIDGLSMQALTKAYTDIYSRLKAGEVTDGQAYFGDDLYPSYVEQQYLHCDNQKSLNFWQKTMLEVEPPKPFNSGTHSSSPNYYSREVKDSPEHMTNIQAYCKQHKIAEITYLKAIYALMIQSECYGKDDFYFSEILAARPKGHNKEIGCYFEQRPTVVPSKDLNNKDFLAFLQAMENYRLEVRSAGRISNGMQQQTFQQGPVSFLFNFYLMPRTLPFDEGQLRMNFITPEMTDAVTLTCIIDDDSLLFTFSYTDNVFQDHDFVERFISLSEQVLAGENNIEKLSLTLDNETPSFEATTSSASVISYPVTSVIELFEQQVQRTPEAIACVYQSVVISYHTLNQQAETLAHTLQQQFNVNAGDGVAICLSASHSFLVTLIAVLKTGAYYIPVDNNYPIGRIQYMLENAQATCIIISKHSVQKIDNTNDTNNVLSSLPNVCLLDSIDLSEKQAFDAATSRAEMTLDSPLYAIYTSGSTGLPKGAVVSQRGEINLITWYNQTFNFTEKDSTLIISSLGFDLTQKNLLAPLCVGARIVLNDEEYEPESIIQLIERHDISFINCAPSAFYPLLDAAKTNTYRSLNSLHTLLFGGEPIRTAELSEWQNNASSKHVRIINMYGPTECTDIASFYCVDDIQAFSHKTIPIGKANDNVQLHIIDAAGKVLPKGSTGQLCISGESLGLGYIAKPDLTAAVFTQHPLLGNIYQTGDLVKHLDDDNFEFVSRIDHQVKIRGLRIELGEIEWQLKSLVGVNDALVIAIDDSLYAYLLAEQTPDNWRSILATQLPAYMVPQYIFSLATWPLTANGKIDRKALPTRIENTRTIITPSNETESSLLDIFQRHLGRSDISIDDNFFDIGGHSLLAARVVADIREMFNQELPLREVFFSPNIQAIATLLNTGELNHVQQLLPPLEVFNSEQQQNWHQDTAQGQYPLSLQQQRLWLIEQIQGSSTMYSMPLTLALGGSVDLAALRLAIHYLSNKHLMLRSRISLKENNPYQYIHSDSINLNLHSFDDETSRQRSIAWDIQKPFNPSHDEALFIAHAYELNHTDSDIILLINQHHIISDGLSNTLLLQDLAKAYLQYTQGDEPETIESPVSYLDYVLWQKQLAKEGVLDQQLNYWTQQLANPPVLQLPVDTLSQNIQSANDGALFNFTISTELQSSIKDIALSKKISEFSIYLSAFAFLLSRYSTQDDIIIGTAVANRPLNNMNDIVGFFVNTLALRLNADKGQTLESFIEHSQHIVDTALSHQSLPFEQLLDALNLERDLSHSPVFQAFFNYQSLSEQTVSDFNINGTEIKAYEPLQSDIELRRQAKFELSLNITQSSVGCAASIEYRTQLFLPSSIERLSQHFIAVLAAFCSQKTATLEQLNFVSKDELEQQVKIDQPHSINNTYVDHAIKHKNFSMNKGVHHYFEDQVSRSLNCTAVTDNQGTLSYNQLNNKANQLARLLQEKGIQTSDSVAICMTRGISMSIALLATLKCGANYVPFDPSFPLERLQFMAHDTQAKLVLFNTLSPFEIPCEAIVEQLPIQLKIPADKETLYQHFPTDNLNIPLPDNIAFNIIYTSGSTGKPKGVIVPHSGIINRLLWMQDTYSINTDDKILQKTPYSFDVSVWELFWPLMFGSELIFAKPDGHKDPDYLFNVINQYGITTMHFVPSMLAVFLHSIKAPSHTSLKQVFCSGEALQVQHVNHFYQLFPDTDLHNLYGPTEASIDVSYYPCKKNDQHAAVPIGKAIANTQLLILDGALNVQPIGIAGELYIGGDNLAIGYLNRDDLNAATFIDNPYHISYQHPSTRLYKTGDVVRLLADGNIAYLGRSDHQVKIRGLRIELGEIENALLQINGIIEACVVAQTINDEQYLCAYISSDKEHSNTLSQSDIQQVLSQQLPHYMLPQFIEHLESLPLSANGKIDRKKLPLLSHEMLQLDEQRNVIAPENELEQQVLQLWLNTLNMSVISCDDNFFSIGGHSLKAAELVSLMRSKFATDIQLRDIFDHNTIHTQAILIEQRQLSSREVPSITAHETREGLPLSYAQQRLWFLNQMDPDSIVYNMPAAIRLTGKINPQALEQALNDLIQRHEVLRSNIHSQSGEPVLVIHNSIETPLRCLTVNDEKALQQACDNDAIHSFDLANDALLRCTLVSINDDDHALLINMHHIMSDAWSIQVLIKELATLYIGYAHQQFIRLDDLSIQYADYAQWQRNWLQGQVLDQQLGYWRKTLAGAPSLLSLPTDFPRPEVQSFKGQLFKGQLDISLVNKLRLLSQENHCTLFMTCLSAYALLLQQHSKQDDICVGIPLAGRSLEGVDKLIGFFINALIIRNDLSANLNLAELLAQTKKQVLSAFAHEHVPIEMLLNELDIERSLAYTPVAQCAFNMITADNSLNDLFNASTLPISMEMIETEQVVAKFDMQFSLLEIDDRINLSIEYASDLFNEQSIEAFYYGYIHILETMVSEKPFSCYTLQKQFNLCENDTTLALPPAIDDMYLSTLARPETLENSMGYGFTFPMEINPEVFKRVIKTIALNNSMCRAYITDNNTVNPTQTAPHIRALNNTNAVFSIIPEDAFSIDDCYSYIDLSDQKLDAKAIKAIAEKNSFSPYSPNQQTLVYYYLYKLSENNYYFNMACSHLVSDGFGAFNHIDLVAKYYYQLSQQTDDSNIRIIADDVYPSSVKDNLITFDTKASLNFWHERLAGVESLSCQTLNQDKLIVKHMDLSQEHYRAIKQYCKQHVITPNIYFKAIYAILIKLYTRTESDFVINEYNTGRSKATMPTLGCFFHSQLSLVQHHALNTNIQKLFKALKSEQKSSRKYLQVSSRQLKRLLPATQVEFSFNYLAFDHHVFIDGVRINGDRFTPNAANSVDFRIQPDSENIDLSIAYNGQLFDDKNFLARFVHISQQLITGQQDDLQQLEYILPEERDANLLVPNIQSTRYQPNQGLTHQIISNIAIQSPSNSAVICGDKNISYVELEMQSNAIANLLIQEGVKIGDRVSILLPKRIELITSLLACMKAGACYVPIDTQYPKERINFILEDSASLICITQSDAIEHVAGQVKAINVDTVDLHSQTTSAPYIELSPDDPVYMIYTSGSTGKPKAASVYHHSEARLLNWYCQEYNLSHKDRSLVISATGFDLSQKNFFALLTQGGTVVFPSSEHYDVNSLLGDIEQHSISVINCAPSAFYPLVELNSDPSFTNLSSLETVLFGGESIQLQRLQFWINSDNFSTTISNMYGPTECTDISCSYTLNAQQLVNIIQSDNTSSFTFPLGTASDGVEIALLDESLQRVPPGLIGEICISGPQVGLGYWQQENLTETSFVKNPYASNTTNQRLYKTGDLARVEWIDEQWQLIYLGRKDFQVKLRGMRIELGEIESALNQVQTIRDATVLVENDELLAFVLSDHAESSNWRDVLLQHLPEYMVPKSLIFLNDWPLTPNGKVNRKALLNIPRSQLSSNQFIAPRTNLEKDLATLWQEVLGVGDIGIHDNFFDSGGDSLKAVRLVARLEMRFEVKVPVASLFGAQTISQLAHIIHNEIHDWSPIVPIQPQGHKTPIFAVHALGAMVLSYEPLSRALGKNQPFYGIQAYGFEEGQTPYTDLHEMVSFYTQAIIEQQPEGPYQLMGHSFGGIIAVEIARKLQHLGKDVTYLAMLDTHMPIRYQAISLDDAGILKIFAEHNFGVVDIPLKTLKLMKPDVMIKKVSEQFNGAVSESFIKSAIAIIRGFQKMMIGYKPSPLNIDIVMIKPQEQQQGLWRKIKGKIFKESTKTLGWHQVAQRVEVIHVGGDHHSMLNKSHAEGLSIQVRKSLQNLNNTSR